MKIQTKNMMILIIIAMCLPISSYSQLSGGLPPISEIQPKKQNQKSDIPKKKIINSESTLSEIIKTNGFDFVLNNYSVVSEALNDVENLKFSSLLLREARSEDAQKILNKLANNENINAISSLAIYHGTGKYNFQQNRTITSKWITKLEQLSLSSDEQKANTATGVLCDIYDDINHLNYGATKARDYCNNYYSNKKVSIASYASKLINVNSALFDPQKGVDLYRKCISEGNPYCKMNYAYAGKSNIHIAKLTSKTELFNLASTAVDLKSPVGLNNLGTFYLYGFGTEKNPGKAVELFKQGASSRVLYSYFNFLEIAFFKYYDITDVIKNKDDALRILNYYEYLSSAKDVDDSSLFKDWLITKNRLPNDRNEFISYLIEKSKSGSSAASCLLADFYSNNGELTTSDQYARNGVNTSNINVKHWCERVLRMNDVERIISQ